MSDLIMNVHASVTGKIALLTPCCMADHYIRTNDECTHVCYSSHYLNVVCHITMSYLMMDVHSSVTNNTAYTLLYVRSLCQI
jgi:alanine racemase